MIGSFVFGFDVELSGDASFSCLVELLPQVLVESELEALYFEVEFGLHGRPNDKFYIMPT